MMVYNLKKHLCLVKNLSTHLEIISFYANKPVNTYSNICFLYHCFKKVPVSADPAKNTMYLSF